MNTRGHLSSETIDLLLLGGLSGTDGQTAHAHLGDCAFCKKRWEELNEDKARFEQFVFPRTVEKIEARLASPSLGERLRAGWKLLVPAAGAVMAAGLAIGLALNGGGGGTQTEDDIYIGVKGNAALDVVASRASLGQFPVKPGSVLYPKDRIRFLVNPAGNKYVMIASRDGKGTFTVYHPFGGSESTTIAQGTREVPGSVELDEVEGPERLVAVFSESPVRADQVKAALEADPASPRVAGAKVVSWEFVKQRP